MLQYFKNRDQVANRNFFTQQVLQYFLNIANGKGLRHQFFDELESRLPDLTVTADAIHAGDEFAVVEWEASGHTAAQDEDEEMGALVLQMHEGRIRRAHLYLDLERWQKLGALKGA